MNLVVPSSMWKLLIRIQIERLYPDPGRAIQSESRKSNSIWIWIQRFNPDRASDENNLNKDDDLGIFFALKIYFRDTGE